MKKLLLICLLAFSLSSCKKEKIVTFKISTIAPKGVACSYSATAPGYPEMTFIDACGKYKRGDVYMRIIE